MRATSQVRPATFQGADAVAGKVTLPDRLPVIAAVGTLSSGGGTRTALASTPVEHCRGTLAVRSTKEGEYRS